MIKVSKLMRVDCDRKKCKIYTQKEVKFDDYKGVEVDFLKDAGFYELKTHDDTLQLCSNCYRTITNKLRQFMREEVEQ